MYSDTVTLFNRRRGKDEDVWYPTVLEGVDLNADQTAIAGKYGGRRGGRALLHIHYGGGKRPVVGGKPYLTPLAWQGAEHPEDAVTFTAGEFFDFFIEGTWPDTGPIRDDAYAGGFYNCLNRTRDGVYAVNSVARYSMIPHFEVVGK